MRGRRAAALIAASLLFAACESGEGGGRSPDARAATDAAPAPGSDASAAGPDAFEHAAGSDTSVSGQDASRPTDAAPVGADAAPVQVDAARAGSDAAPVVADASEPEDGDAPSPDAGVDAAPPAPDAAPPAPDAAPPSPDAAPPSPDAAPPQPRPVLNEVQCRDDEWIEVFNAGDAPFDATGWVVTDDPDDRARDALLPADLVVPAFGFVVARELPFGVACGDDTIRLLAPDRSPADRVALGDPLAGSTWGRLPDGSGDWQATRPTPGLPNAEPGVPTVRLNEIDCHGRDWVEIVNVGDGPADLTGWAVTSDVLDAAVAFPLHGTLEPGEFDRIQQQDEVEDGFTFGIDCGAATITLLDANGAIVDEVTLSPAPDAWTWGRLPDGEGDWTSTDRTPEAPNAPPAAPAATLFDPEHVFLVDLALDPAAQQALTADPRTYVPATMRVTVGDIAYPPLEVGLHIKGRAGSYRTLDRKSAFKVKINFADPAQRLDGLKKLTFNNQVQDPSIIHEFAAYSIFREVGVPVPRLGYAFLRVNDQIYGLYAHVETYDDVLLDRHFPSTRHLFEGAYGQDLFAAHLDAFEVDEGDPMERADLAALVALAEAPPPEGFYAATQDLIDWPEVLKVMATEIYIGHWDGYAPTRNNYFLHFDNDGRMSLFPWGTDQTFSQPLPFHQGRGRMLELCRLEPACLEAFDLALGEVVAAVDRLPLRDRIVQLAETLRPWSEQDVRREYDLNAIQANQQATLAFLDARRGDVEAQFPCLAVRDLDGDGRRCHEDCDEEDPNRYVGALEVCGDGIDNDCSGRSDDHDDCPDCQEVRRGARRYLVCPWPRTFDAVDPHCREAGSAPVVIDGPAENAWLVNQTLAVGRMGWWIGLDDLGQEGRFLLPDGRAPTYTRWAAGEPDDAGGAEDCAQLREDGYWGDRGCGERIGVLCEDPCPPGGLDADHDGFDGCGADCDDSQAGVRPGANEVCGDGIDNDCNGLVDDGPACICTEYRHGGHDYLVCTQPMPWDQARLECRSRGSDLAVLGDAAEDAWLTQQAMAVRRQHYWIGLWDSAEEGQFRWVDRSALAYTRWGAAQPDDAGGAEDCAAIQGDDTTWGDFHCASPAGFLCEFSD